MLEMFLLMLAVAAQAVPGGGQTAVATAAAAAPAIEVAPAPASEPPAERTGSIFDKPETQEALPEQEAAALPEQEPQALPEQEAAALPTFLAPAPAGQAATPTFLAPAPSEQAALPTFLAPAPTGDVVAPTFLAPAPTGDVVTPTFLAPTGTPGLVAEPQVATGKFTTALEVKPILGATKGNWIGVREYDGQDLLYVTHLWSWRCGLLEIRIGINGATPEPWPLPECHMEMQMPSVMLEGDGLPFRAFALGSIATIEVQLTYDDLTTDSMTYQRHGIMIP